MIDRPFGEMRLKLPDRRRSTKAGDASGDGGGAPSPAKFSSRNAATSPGAVSGASGSGDSAPDDASDADRRRSAVRTKLSTSRPPAPPRA